MTVFEWVISSPLMWGAGAIVLGVLIIRWLSESEEDKQDRQIRKYRRSEEYNASVERAREHFESRRREARYNEAPNGYPSHDTRMGIVDDRNAMQSTADGLVDYEVPGGTINIPSGTPYNTVARLHYPKGEVFPTGWEVTRARAFSRVVCEYCGTGYDNNRDDCPKCGGPKGR
jgi:hypothetical protein